MRAFTYNVAFFWLRRTRSQAVIRIGNTRSRFSQTIQMETADFEQQMQMSQQGLLKMVFSLTRQQTQFRYEIATLMKNMPNAT